FLGDLHLGLSAEVRHLEHLSLFGGEVGEGLSDLFPPHAEVGLLGDGIRRVFADQRFEVRRPLRSGSQAGLASDQIDGPMVHERKEERSEGSPCRVERFGRSPERHEGIVDDVLRQDLLARHAVGEPVGGPCVPPIELIERAPVARGESPVELEILTVAIAHEPYPPSRCEASSSTRAPGAICATKPGARSSPSSLANRSPSTRWTSKRTTIWCATTGSGS